MTNNNNSPKRISFYKHELLDDALPEVAQLLDEEGYYGMYRPSGNINTSAVLNACVLILAGKNKALGRKNDKKYED